MTQEDYVSFEIANLLKEKGFECIGDHSYDSSSKRITNVNFPCNNSAFIPAPTLQMAMKWLREVHNVFISISIVYINNKLTYLWIPCVIKKVNIDYPTMEEYMADSYKEACEAAIKYCLTNLI